MSWKMLIQWFQVESSLQLQKSTVRQMSIQLKHAYSSSSYFESDNVAGALWHCKIVPYRKSYFFTYLLSKSVQNVIRMPSHTHMQTNLLLSNCSTDDLVVQSGVWLITTSDPTGPHRTSLLSDVVKNNDSTPWIWRRHNETNIKIRSTVYKHWNSLVTDNVNFNGLYTANYIRIKHKHESKT